MKMFSKMLFAFLVLVGVSTVHAEVKPIKEVFEPDSSLYPAEQYGKVAVVQWAPTGWAPLSSKKAAEDFKASNRRTLEKYIREAASKGAELVVTPEFGVVEYPDIPELPDEDDNFQNREQASLYAELKTGGSFKFFSALAKELKVIIHYGYMERDAQTDIFYNAVNVVGPKGELKASYRKMHLFEIEVDYLEEGDQITTYESQFGKTGIIICSDVYGNTPMNDYARAKLDVIVLSTSWAQYNTGWGYFTRGARWVKAPMLAANQNYFPDSGVINADGSTQSHIRQSTGLAYGYLRYKN